MDHRQVGWIVIGVLFCMSFTVDIVQGKCTGKWASAACFGGNKRSEGDDISMSKSKSAFLPHLLSKTTLPRSLVRQLINHRREHFSDDERTSGLSDTGSYVSDSDILMLLNRLGDRE